MRQRTRIVLWDILLVSISNIIFRELCENLVNGLSEIISLESFRPRSVKSLVFLSGQNVRDPIPYYTNCAQTLPNVVQIRNLKETGGLWTVFANCLLWERSDTEEKLKKHNPSRDGAFRCYNIFSSILEPFQLPPAMIHPMLSAGCMAQIKDILDIKSPGKHDSPRSSLGRSIVYSSEL